MKARGAGEFIGPMYRLTEAGRAALQSRDAAVPSDYRTILWVMDFHGADHVQDLVQLYPQQLLSDCLAEMHELRLIEQVHVAADTSAKTLSGACGPDEVYSVTSADLLAARVALTDHGAYVAGHRLKSRGSSAKPIAETTVLIVEDDPDQLALADVRVSMAGYVVR